MIEKLFFSILEKIVFILESRFFQAFIALLTIVLTYGFLTNWTFELAIQSAR